MYGISKISDSARQLEFEKLLRPSEKISPYIMDNYLFSLTKEEDAIGFIPCFISQRCQCSERHTDMRLGYDIINYCTNKIRLFAPISINEHWVLLDIIPFAHTINVYNSLEKIELKDETIRNIGIALEYHLPLEYNNLNYILQNSPQQSPSDTLSSGIFTLMNAFCLTREMMFMKYDIIMQKGRENIYALLSGNLEQKIIKPTVPAIKRSRKRESVQENQKNTSSEESKDKTHDKKKRKRSKLLITQNSQIKSPPQIDDDLPHNSSPSQEDIQNLPLLNDEPTSNSSLKKDENIIKKKINKKKTLESPQNVVKIENSSSRMDVDYLDTFINNL